MTTPYGSDSLARAGQPDPTYGGQPATRAPADDAKVRLIRDSVAQMNSGQHAPHNGSSIRVVVLLIVGRVSVIPVFLFIVCPKKAAEFVGPMVATTGKHITELSGSLMNFMGNLAQKITESFKPFLRFTNKVQEAITNAFQTSVEAYKTLQRTLSEAMAKISAPFKQAANHITKAIANWNNKAAQLKAFLANLGQYLKSDVSAPRAAPQNPFGNAIVQLLKTAKTFTEKLEKNFEQFVERTQAKLKQVKEKILEPIKKLTETVVKSVQENVAATIAHIQTAAAPIINLSVTAGLAAKGIVEGHLKNIVQMAQSLSAQVQNAAQAVGKAIYQVYQQILVQHLIAPFMASLQAGWSRVATVQEKLWNNITARLNQISRELKEHVERILRSLQAAFGAIKDWTQQKWKQKWLPALKQIPKKALAISKQLLHYTISFWRALLFVFKELLMLFVALGQNFVRMVRRALGEVVVQPKNQR